MTIRVVIGDVQNILPADTGLTDPQIQMAIDAASCLVDQIAADCGSHLNDDCLFHVELYLSAHYAAATENTLTKTSETDPCCGGSVSYGFKFGEGVKGTPFGQMANTLSGGCLAEYDKQPASIVSLGTLGWDT